jgi:hypothetical protein
MDNDALTQEPIPVHHNGRVRQLRQGIRRFVR